MRTHRNLISAAPLVTIVSLLLLTACGSNSIKPYPLKAEFSAADNVNPEGVSKKPTHYLPTCAILSSESFWSYKELFMEEQ